MADRRGNVLHSKQEDEAKEFSNRFVFRLLDMVRQELRETGDRDWMVDCVDQASVRLSHIEGVSRRVSSGLSKLGFGPGQTLHTAYNSCLDFYWPVFGAWLNAGVVSVADPLLSVDAVKGQLEDTKASIVVCTADAAIKYVEANKKIKETLRVKHILVIDKEPWQDLPQGCTSFRSLYNDDGSKCPQTSSLPKHDNEEVAVIHWTSGTSGKPKGVMHTQRYLHRMLKPSKLPQRSISLSSNIMFHAGAFLLPFDGGIMNKFTCCLIKEEDFNGPKALEAISNYKPAFYMAGTNHVLALASQEANDYDLSSIFCIMPAGGAVSAGIASNLKTLFPNLAMVYMFYGSTEVSGISGSMDVTCLGALVPGVQVYIRDRETGEKLGPNQAGEIMVKTKTMMTGYLNRYDETEEFYDDEGFAHMGDLGYYDEEGKLFYKERIKELIKVSNYWFGPGEVENVLEEIPCVAEAAVWGSYNKHSGDDLVNAAIVLTTGPKLEVITREDIVHHVANNLQIQKHITGNIIFLDSIPHNPQGKKLRRELKTKYSTN